MLDVYDANRRLIGTADRNVVHACGLWHKTVHCWIVWRGKLVFQRRAAGATNGGKLYTTASGHVSAGESIETAFAREIAGEIGIKPEHPRKLSETVWIGDFKKSDGTMFIDRVFANVFFAEYDGWLGDFKFDDGEVDAVVAIDLDKFIEFARAGGTCAATEFDGHEIHEIIVLPADFVLIGDETVYGKYAKNAEQIKAELEK